MSFIQTIESNLVFENNPGLQCVIIRTQFGDFTFQIDAEHVGIYRSDSGSSCGEGEIYFSKNRES